MNITEKVFLKKNYSTPSFFVIKNPVDQVEDAEIIVINHALLYAVTYREIGITRDFHENDITLEQFEMFLSLNKPIYIESTYELIEQSFLLFFNRFTDLKNVTYFCNPRSSDYQLELRTILYNKGLTIVEKQFFIENAHVYVPDEAPVLSKKFLCMNGKTRPERTLLVSYLSYHNLIDKGHVSFFGNHINRSFDENKIEDVFSLNLSVEQKQIVEFGLRKLNLPLTLDVPIMNAAISGVRTYPARYYDAVDFVLVAETQYGTFFPTEKTIKAINHNKKIMVHSDKHFIKNLKDYYYTYKGIDISPLTDWCGVAYDEYSSIDRVEYIIHLIKKQIYT